MKGKLVILVTGSSGFAGEVLIPKLKKKEFEIIGLDWKKGKYTDLIQDISKPFAKRIRSKASEMTEKEFF